MRNIFIVNATQVVTSESHPEGVLSKVSGYPIERDSRSYGATEQNPNGDTDIALIVAQSDYADAIKNMAVANNPARVMWAVTLTDAYGIQIAKKKVGAFPDMTPAPVEEPEEE